MKLLITMLCLDGASALVIARDVKVVANKQNKLHSNRTTIYMHRPVVANEQNKVQNNKTTIYCIGQCLPAVRAGWRAGAVLIVSGSNQEREWSKQIRENHRLYAEFHGYRYMYAYMPGWKNMSLGKEPQWLKVLVLLACLQDTHLQYVLWVDDDIVFTTKSNFLSSLIEDLRDKNLLIARDIRLDQVNTGIMLFRRCQHSVDVLVRLWYASNSRLGYCPEQSCFHEQEALNTLIEDGEVEARIVNPVNELYNLNTMWRISHFDEVRRNLRTGGRMYLDYDENDPPGQRWRWGMNMAHVSGMTPVCRAPMLKWITEYTKRVVFGFSAYDNLLEGPTSAVQCTSHLRRKSTLLEKLRWFPNANFAGSTRITHVDLEVDYPSNGGNFLASPLKIGRPIRDNFILRLTGQLIVKDEGEYEFFTLSSNGSRLTINGAQIANNSGKASLWKTTSLPVGRHNILLEFPNQTKSSSGLMFSFRGPNAKSQSIVLPSFSPWRDVVQNRTIPANGEALWANVTKVLKVPDLNVFQGISLPSTIKTYAGEALWANVTKVLKVPDLNALDLEAPLPLPPKTGSSGLTILASSVLLLVALGMKSMSLENPDKSDDCSHVTNTTSGQVLGNTELHENTMQDKTVENGILCGGVMPNEVVESAELMKPTDEAIETQLLRAIEETRSRRMHQFSVETTNWAVSQLLSTTETAEAAESQQISPMETDQLVETQLSNAVESVESIKSQLSILSEAVESVESQLPRTMEKDESVESLLMSHTKTSESVDSQLMCPTETGESVESQLMRPTETGESVESQLMRPTEAGESVESQPMAESDESQSLDPVEAEESEESDLSDETAECAESHMLSPDEIAESVETAESVGSSLETVESVELQPPSTVETGEFIELQFLNSSADFTNTEGDFVLVQAATNQIVDFVFIPDGQDVV